MYDNNNEEEKDIPERFKNNVLQFRRKNSLYFRFNRRSQLYYKNMFFVSLGINIILLCFLALIKNGV